MKLFKLFLKINIILFLSILSTNSSHAQEAVSETTIESTTRNMEVLTKYSSYPNVGKTSAKLKLYIFHDIKCGMCTIFFSDALLKIIEEYVNNGKMQIFFVDFPLFEGEQAALSISAICANEQGQYLKYVKYLHDNFTTTKASKISEYIKLAGLDLHKYAKCREKPMVYEQFDRNVEIGNLLNIDMTPTFFLNGRRMVGASSFDEFKKTFDQMYSDNTK